MIQRKLSKAQGYAVQVLAVQLNQLQAQIVETQDGVNALAELYRAHFKLPEGNAQFNQGPDGWTLVVTPTEKKTPAAPEPTLEEAKRLAMIAELEAELSKGPQSDQEADDDPEPPPAVEAA